MNSNSSNLLDTRNQARILEFEMSVHRICEFDPFWTKKSFCRKTDTQDRHSERRTDIEAQIVV